MDIFCESFAECGILERYFLSRLLVINRSLVFYPLFSVLQNGIHEKTRVFLFRRFFVRIFKAREEYGFFFKSDSRSDCEEHGAKDSESFVKLMSKNFISGSTVKMEVPFVDPVVPYCYHTCNLKLNIQT
jgi:hypothetical protein